MACLVAFTRLGDGGLPKGGCRTEDRGRRKLHSARLPTAMGRGVGRDGRRIGGSFPSCAVVVDETSHQAVNVHLCKLRKSRWIWDGVYVCIFIKLFTRRLF
jgi:hypothetical protein